MIKVKAGEFAEALKPAKPHPLKKRPKPIPISLEQELVSGAFVVVEAQHAIFANKVRATGNWPNAVQVDGVTLCRLVATWPPHEELELSADPEALKIVVGKSVSRVKRIDSGGNNPILRMRLEPDPRHKGKVAAPPDPTTKRVELADTWGFSARVPMPQHRDPDKGE